MIVIPETGGAFSMSGGRLGFERPADPALAVMRELAGACEDAAALEKIYGANPAVLEVIDGSDSSHLLRHSIDNVGRTTPGPDRERRMALALGRTALTVVENGAEDYVRALPASGAVWHLHPPHFTAKGWFVGEVPGDDEGGPAPSSFDHSSAAERGQNLTLVFHSDGFDAYDLAGSRRIEYRSEDWRRAFDALHSELAGRLVP
jgi:hypothetical protein